ncbi:MAG: endo alpha-1,4 polygalactosaminidase [Gemmatimonadetes bacterium]|nr:endo alpha-1,4 polygalactosaminidase [Gemmatimonadota bacterium]
MTSTNTLVLAMALVGCGDDSSGPEGTLDPNIPPITDGNWYRPGVATTWQWQLLGTVNTAYSVDVYDIDLFDVSASTIASLQAAGKRVICYFSAGSFEDFRSDANRFPQEVLGNTLEGFADERWLDIRSSIVLDIMSDRLDIAVQKGCDGVEPDNVDGYVNNSGFDLTAADQLAFNRRIANAAHERGLAVALKNDLDQILDLIAYFDLSVNEQCHEFDECSLLQPFVTGGKAVFNAEYDSRFVSDAAVRDGMCAAARADNLRTLILPLDLDDSFRFSCDS